MTHHNSNGPPVQAVPAKHGSKLPLVMLSSNALIGKSACHSLKGIGLSFWRTPRKAQLSCPAGLVPSCKSRLREDSHAKRASGSTTTHVPSPPATVELSDGDDKEPASIDGRSPCMIGWQKTGPRSTRRPAHSGCAFAAAGA